MGKLLILLLFLFTFSKSVLAVYDPLSVSNNKVGIHILDTNEIDKAGQLVNSNGGEWGYVTIPIRANDRNLPKWITFMERCKSLKVIPIIRIASFPISDTWAAPNEYEILDMANFLNELPWPTKNRYVIIYNEPNQTKEWGGYFYPQEYARVLDRSTDIFHKTNEQFFVISAGMDSSQPTLEYFRDMEIAWPGVLNRVDGLSFHAYGNPGFVTYPNVYSRVNIGSYKFETNYLCNYFDVCNKPIFLTEVGWRVDNIGQFAAQKYYEIAFKDFWTEDKIVAITPFVLDARYGDFSPFSFVDQSGNWKPFVKSILDLEKAKGKPIMAEKPKNDETKPLNSTNVSFDINDIMIWQWIGKLRQIFYSGSK